MRIALEWSRGRRRTKSAIPVGLQSADSSRSLWTRIIEPFAGAWQQNIEWRLQDVLQYAPVFACIRLISTDIAKMRCRVVVFEDQVWRETSSPAYSPVLRKPNRYQTRIKFFQHWAISKLTNGNAYVLKQRDERNVVNAMFVLDPLRVKVLIAPDGGVYYALNTNNLANIDQDVVVPASEIIHDVYLPLYHPLCGVSPITACALAAIEALRIQENSALVFGNGQTAGGVITGPAQIPQDMADRIARKWNEGFTGANAGKVAVLGYGLDYKAIGLSAVDAQLIEQLKWTAEDVCQAFGVPPWKINVGPAPNLAGGSEAINLQYYSQCLQELLESIEELLDFGLGMAPDLVDGRRIGSEFNRDDLLQMDTAGRVDAATKTISGGALAPNEARVRWLDAPPVKGGGSPMLQQQQFSLEALAERDADKPFSKPTPAAPATPATTTTPTPPDAPAPDDATDDATKAGWLRRALDDLAPVEL